jgi:hypothetical protein
MNVKHNVIVFLLACHLQTSNACFREIFYMFRHVHRRDVLPFVFIISAIQYPLQETSLLVFQRCFSSPRLAPATQLGKVTTNLFS